jgi:hypothetical protein
MTWLLVKTRPPEVRIMPVPIAVEPCVENVDVMSTRPGSTLVATLAAAAFAFFCVGVNLGAEMEGWLIR